MNHVSSAHEVRSLRDTLAYENDMVVYKFMERYRLSLRQTRDLFTETKRFLWLCARTQVVPSAPATLSLIGMREMHVVDEMWHTFMLFTSAYQEFCHRYFGRFIHHTPSTRKDRNREVARWRADPEKYEQEKLATLRRELTFVGQELGASTLRKWFTTFGSKYTPENMERLRVPLARPVAPAHPRRTARQRSLRRTEARPAPS